MAILKLNQIATKEVFTITALPSQLRSELIRLGICEGDTLQCIAKIPRGPVVIKKDLLEIAIGQDFAACIDIRTND